MNKRIFVGDMAATLKNIQQFHCVDDLYNTKIQVEMNLVDFTDLCECGFMPVSHSGIPELDGSLVYIGEYSLVGVKTAIVTLICRDTVRLIHETNER